MLPTLSMRSREIFIAESDICHDRECFFGFVDRSKRSASSLRSGKILTETIRNVFRGRIFSLSDYCHRISDLTTLWTCAQPHQNWATHSTALLRYKAITDVLFGEDCGDSLFAALPVRAMVHSLTNDRLAQWFPNFFSREVFFSSSLSRNPKKYLTFYPSAFYEAHYGETYGALEKHEGSAEHSLGTTDLAQLVSPTWHWYPTTLMLNISYTNPPGIMSIGEIKYTIKWIMKFKWFMVRTIITTYQLHWLYIHTNYGAKSSQYNIPRKSNIVEKFTC